MINIQNWQQQRVKSARMQGAALKPPTWEDVIMLVSLKFLVPDSFAV
jgi:hypothetical protein